LLITEARLREMGLQDADFAALHASVEAEAEDAYQFADSSPEPDPARLYEYTYAP
jgi:TPP-dependent pyruvate/acetoin dehydrogenase alpha subunit